METRWKRIRRRLLIVNDLHFDYEASLAFSPKMVEEAKSVNASAPPLQTPPPDGDPSIQLSEMPPTTIDPAPTAQRTGKIGDYVPFKQSRLKGQANPLRPPLHVETVLIGRALGQPTGYLFGVGYRIHNDGHVEAEFADGIRKFETYDEFKTELTDLIARNKSC
jgi:hypothetical protein